MWDVWVLGLRVRVERLRSSASRVKGFSKFSDTPIRNIVTPVIPMMYFLRSSGNKKERASMGSVSPLAMNHQ